MIIPERFAKMVNTVELNQFVKKDLGQNSAGDIVKLKQPTPLPNNFVDTKYSVFGLLRFVQTISPCIE